MNNKKLIYTVAGVIVVVVIAAILFYGNKNEASAPVTGGGPMSMQDLLARGDNQMCTFTSNQDGVESAGTVYVANGNMRGDFTARLESGEELRSHMIVQGQTAYIWTDQMEQGMQMDFSAMSEQSSEATAPGNTGFDPSQQVDYDCDRWSPDQNRFDLPDGVVFIDLSATMQDAMGTGACAQCNIITDGGARAQCLAALECN